MRNANLTQQMAEGCRLHSGGSMVYAFDANDRLVHCGPFVLPNVITKRWCRRYQAAWERWADGVARRCPGCPTDKARRTTAIIVVEHPFLPRIRCRLGKRGAR